MSDEELLEQAVRNALEHHTIECVARYIAYPIETVERWAFGPPWAKSLFFKGHGCEEAWTDVLDNVRRLETVTDCLCQHGFDFSRLDGWERGAIRFLPTFT